VDHVIERLTPDGLHPTSGYHRITTVETQQLVFFAGRCTPGPRWGSDFPAEASRSTLPASLRQLDNALRATGACLDPLLAGHITTGTWDPHGRDWRPKP
jgi:hypothetical protein